jgi:hypothetical protein
VPEHVETRKLYNPAQPDVEQVESENGKKEYKCVLVTPKILFVFFLVFFMNL